MRWTVVTSLLPVPWGGGRGRRLPLNTVYLHSHNNNFHHSGRAWETLGCLVRDLLLTHRSAFTCTSITGPSQIRANPSRPSPTRRLHPHNEHSPSPTPSSYSSGFTRAPAHENRQGIAPQPMRHTFTHPGGWPDRLQRTRTRGSVGSATRARTTSRPPSYPSSTPSQERLGKRKRPTSAERSTAVPQTAGTAGTQRETVGPSPQRSHRRHHNVAEKTHSTLLPSGGMYMTFPLDIPSPEPEIEGGAPAGPPPFAHGPTELPPRPYETQTAEEGSGPERPAKRGRLPADVMDHVSATRTVICATF